MKEEDLGQLIVNGTRGNSPWRKLFRLVPASDRLAESSCIKWKVQEDYPAKDQKVSLPPALPVDNGGESEEDGGE